MAGFSSYRVFRDVVPEVTSDLVGPNTAYPIGVDYETIFKWYYRVKEWSVSIDFICDASASGPDTSATTALTSPSTGTLFKSISFTDESYFSTLIPTSSGTPTEQNDADIDPGSLSNSQAFSNFINAGFGPIVQIMHTPNPIVRIGAVYYPRLKCDLYVNAAASVEYEGVRGENKTIYVDRPTELGSEISILWQLDSESFNKTGSFDENSFPGGGTASVTVNVTQITITPSKYWTYNVTGVGDIWDEDTGDQLVNPFSVQQW